MKKLGLLLALAFIAPQVRVLAQETAAASTEEKIEWLDIEEAQKRAKKKRKKIFIDVYTDWCGWCKVMDKKTFSHPEIAAYLNKNFYSVKMNAEKRDNIIFNEELYKFNEQGKSHNLAIKLLNGQMSYPSTVYLDEKLNVIQAVPGFHNAKDFDAILHYFSENHYKKTAWEKYKAEFQSKIQ